MNVHCSNGHDNAPGSAFCSTCGTPLAGQPGAPPASAIPYGEPPAIAIPPSAPDATGEAGPTPPGLAPIPGQRPEQSTNSPYGAATGPYPGQHATSAAGRRPSKRVLIFGAAAAVAVLVGTGIAVAVTGGDGDGGGAATGNGQSIRGIAMLFDADGSIDGSWDSCEGTGGYSDFGAGMRLSIKGQSDEIVGSGDVENVTEANIADVAKAELDGDSPIGLDATSQEAAEEELRDMLESSEGMACMVYFEADIESSEYYAVELGSRGDLSYSREELAKNGYVVGISLGDI